jgi:hypothetical protein
MSGRRSGDKGSRNERALVRLLQAAGFAAERVPLSGSASGRFVGDLSLPLLGVDGCVEVKCRANGFRKLYAWLDGCDLLIVRADRRAKNARLRCCDGSELAWYRCTPGKAKRTTSSRPTLFASPRCSHPAVSYSPSASGCP